jgi:hypothetical protein
MNYSVKSVGKRTIAGFHMVGPWEQTVKQGLSSLWRGSAAVRFRHRSGWPFTMTIPIRFHGEAALRYGGHRGRRFRHSAQQRRGYSH